VTRSSRPAPDGAAGASRSIEVRFVGHATTLIHLAGIRVLTDPFLRSRLGPLKRHGPAPDPRELFADVVVISHGHPDHFDRGSLAALPGEPVLVVPRGLGSAARRVRERGDVLEIDAGQTIDLGALSVHGVPARHWISPGAPRARPIGYVLDAGPRAYFAGDTGRYDGMRQLTRDVDLALLPVWTWGPHLGPGHLGPRSAAEVAAEIEPRVVVPIHWGTLYPPAFERIFPRRLTEPATEFATWVGRISPSTAVHALLPGGATRIEL
jgi:L-ascorbate metabolism protein UlaG (beta-lactamase superfamily)